MSSAPTPSTIEQLQGEAYRNFVIHLVNPVTRRNYMGRLKDFMQYCQTDNADQLLFNGDTSFSLLLVIILFTCILQRILLPLLLTFTGESIPVDKKPGDEVIGATVNKQGLLEVKATKVGVETALSQIVHIVEEAQTSTAKIQRLADSVSAKFVPAVVSVAITSFVIWYLVMGNFVMGLLSFIAVLIIACPCALGIATPAALMVGVGKGAEAGILIRGAEYLERSQKINTGN